MKNKSLSYSSTFRYAVLLLFALGLSFTTQAQSWNEVIKIAASDRARDDYFGSSVSISGDYAIV
ncbi:MAG: FG-GAP repeat protein [Bacteroidota bacterium]